MNWVVVQATIRQRLFQRPWLLKWLDEAPMPVQVADEELRRSYLFRKFPLSLALLLLFKICQWLGVFPHPFWGLWLLAVTLIVFIWPSPMVRMGRVACEHARYDQGPMRRRLQVLCLVNRLLAGMSFVFSVALFIGMVWLTVMSV